MGLIVDIDSQEMTMAISLILACCVSNALNQNDNNQKFRDEDEKKNFSEDTTRTGNSETVEEVETTVQTTTPVEPTCENNTETFTVYYDEVDEIERVTRKERAPIENINIHVNNDSEDLEDPPIPNVISRPLREEEHD
ncbi:hypothetical protein A3Q56_03029 [Intoshia linei]|uniref:Uncharacterized protein n=1 Tax=Intoshia linei TaxID=1819745 RepID=A0A177B4R8_9BILA|nr:hypothetical protein A3Q56_03029 [Intoshia linei]